MAAAGNIAGAQIQLAEIRARGGAGSWPERALMQVLQTGKAAHY